jgi:PadR family transcriptional regulator PadR
MCPSTPGAAPSESVSPGTRPPTPELLQGTLDVMILSVLARAPLHGYAIARDIERRSGRVLQIEEGSLYPALHRMTKRGDLLAEWGQTDTGRRARFYRLSTSGRQRLSEQRSLWDRLSGAVSRVVAPEVEPGRAAPGNADTAGRWGLA